VFFPTPVIVLYLLFFLTYVGLSFPYAEGRRVHGSPPPAGVVALALQQAARYGHAAAHGREHGSRLQESTIIGLEHHTPENIVREIENAIAHRTEFHQFMLYTPVPGTPLFKEMSEPGRMLEGVDLADIQGQYKFNFQHSAISRDDSKRFLDCAFRRDFEENGTEFVPNVPHFAAGMAALQGLS